MSDLQHLERHTCQPIQFTSIKYSFCLFVLFCFYFGHTGKWTQENIIFMRFCCCFKLSKKIEKLSNEQPMNAITKCTLAGLVKYAKKSEVRFKVVRAYLAQHCFFLPLPHVPIGIQNAAGTSKKTKDPSLHKGNTGSQTLD